MPFSKFLFSWSASPGFKRPWLKLWLARGTCGVRRHLLISLFQKGHQHHFQHCVAAFTLKVKTSWIKTAQGSGQWMLLPTSYQSMAKCISYFCCRKKGQTQTTEGRVSAGSQSEGTVHRGSMAWQQKRKVAGHCVHRKQKGTGAGAQLFLLFTFLLGLGPLPMRHCCPQ